MSEKDRELLESCLKGWFAVGKLGGFNSTNLQVGGGCRVCVGGREPRLWGGGPGAVGRGRGGAFVGGAAGVGRSAVCYGAHLGVQHAKAAGVGRSAVCYGAHLGVQQHGPADSILPNNPWAPKPYNPPVMALALGLTLNLVPHGTTWYHMVPHGPTRHHTVPHGTGKDKIMPSSLPPVADAATAYLPPALQPPPATAYLLPTTCPDLPQTAAAAAAYSCTTVRGRTRASSTTRTGTWRRAWPPTCMT